MNAKLQPALFLLALAASAGAEAGTVVIDDFTDTAAIQEPDGPAQALTSGVGELNAERRLRTRRWAPDFFTTIARADINSTVPGQYFVDMDDAGGLPSSSWSIDFQRLTSRRTKRSFSM